MKKMILTVIGIFLFGYIFLSAFMPHGESFKEYEKYKYAFFPHYSTIDGEASEKDLKIADEIINLAGKIMTSSDYDEDRAGELKEYSFELYENEKTTHTEADLQLINADFTRVKGYMWIRYTLTLMGEDNVIIEQKQALALWRLKKHDGVWRVTDIRQTGLKAD